MKVKNNLSGMTACEDKADELAMTCLGGSDRGVVTYGEMHKALIKMAIFAAQHPQEKVKAVKGVQGKGAEVIKVLEALGGKNAYGLDCDNGGNYYYVNQFGIIDYIKGECAEKAIADGLAEEMRLPDKPQCDLKPFERVLVMDLGCQKWRPSLFGNFDGNVKEHPYYTMSGYHCQRVRYEGNEHLLGTDADPE